MAGRVHARRGRAGSTKAVESHPMKLDELSPVDSPAEIEKKEGRFGSLYVRTFSGVAFILLFTLIIYLGHLYCLGLLLCLQALITRELFELARKTANVKLVDEEKDLPGFRVQQWYIFSVASFYMHGRLLHEILLVELSSSTSTLSSAGRVLMSGLWVVLKRHMLITYILYLLGFVMSVLSLKKGKYMYQFGQYSWTITIILFVLVQTSFFVSNIFDGLIW